MGIVQTAISLRALCAAAMKAAARTGSTGFQVTPSCLRCVPTIAPSAVSSVLFMVPTVTPVLARTGVPGTAALTVCSSFEAGGQAGDRAGDEDGVDAQEGGAAGSFFCGAVAKRAGEFGGDVGEDGHVLLVCFGGGFHQAEVAFVDAGEHLADEAGAGGPGHGQARDRVPDNIYAERNVDLLAEFADQRGHGGRGLGAGPEPVGQVGLVAEQQAVHARRLERVEVAGQRVEDGFQVSGRVVAWAARQGTGVHHGDDRLGRAEQVF